MIHPNSLFCLLVVTHNASLSETENTHLKRCVFSYKESISEEDFAAVCSCVFCDVTPSIQTYTASDFPVSPGFFILMTFCN